MFKCTELLQATEMKNKVNEIIFNLTIHNTGKEDRLCNTSVQHI